MPKNKKQKTDKDIYPKGKPTPYELEFERLQKLLHESEIEFCQNCGGSLREDKVNLEDYSHGRIFLMNDVPAYICENCGETWVPGEVMKEFEKMQETAKKYHKALKALPPKKSFKKVSAKKPKTRA